MMAGKHEERVVSVGVVVEAGVLGLIGLFLSLAFFLFNVRLRSNRLIKMSSPILNLFIACGGILLSVCSALYGLDYFLRDFTDVASAVCQSRAGLLACGSTLLFGPMFLKSWRVYRLFQNAGKKRMVIKDSRLLLMTGGLLMFDVMMLIAWHTTDPLQFQPVSIYRQVDSMREEATPTPPDNITLHVTLVHACTSPSSHNWLAAFLLLKMALLCYGLFLSWQTRAVALPSMNDSQCIVVSSLTTATMATLVVWVTHVLQDRPNVVQACVVLAVWLCAVVTLCMAFVPKVSLWWRNPEAKDLRVSATSMCSSSPLFPLQHLEEELSQAADENAALRKSLEEKEGSIRQLQQHLTNAYKRLSHLGLNLDLIQDSGLDADLSSSSDSENIPDPPKHPALTCSISETQRHTDSQNVAFCDGCGGGGGVVARNGHSCGEMSREDDSSVRPGKGSNSSALLENGGFFSSPINGQLAVSVGESRVAPGLSRGHRGIEKESLSQGGSDRFSLHSSNTSGDFPVSSVSIRKTSQDRSQSSNMTSYIGGQVIPGLSLAKLSRRRSRQDFMHSTSAHQEMDESGRLTHSLVFDGENRASDPRLNSPPSRQDSTNSDTAKASSIHSSDRRYRRTRRHHRRRHSANSVTSSRSSDKLSELRVAIAQDLQHARSLSNILSNSVSKELDNINRRRSRRMRRRSSSVQSREDLAESIVGSYGLDDTRDTRSYVSSFLPVPASLSDRNGDLPASPRTELSVLGNDVLYPEGRHKNSVTPLYGRDKGQVYTPTDRGYRVDGNSHSANPKREMKQYQGKSLIEREEIPHNPTRPSVSQNRIGRVPNISLQGICDPATVQVNCHEDHSRSRLQLQNSGEKSQEVFSVQVAPTPRFVQKGYAQTRALYSMDTVI